MNVQLRIIRRNLLCCRGLTTVFLLFVLIFTTFGVYAGNSLPSITGGLTGQGENLTVLGESPTFDAITASGTFSSNSLTMTGSFDGSHGSYANLSFDVISSWVNIHGPDDPAYPWSFYWGSEGTMIVRGPGYSDTFGYFRYGPGIYMAHLLGENLLITMLPASTTKISGATSSPNYGKNVRNPKGFVQEPVDTGSGAHVITITIFKIQSDQDFKFIIDYDSICHFEDTAGIGWSHNFEETLQQVTINSFLLKWNSKRANLFSLLQGRTNVYTCPDLPVLYDTLTQNTDGSFTLKEPNQRQHFFDSFGRLRQLANSHDQKIQLFYSYTNSYPTQIVESVSSKSLNLTYDTNNLLYTVTDDAARCVKFVYNENKFLSKIIRNDSTLSLTNSFGYDQSGHVTSETNSEGIQVFFDTYDTNGCVATQEDAAHGIANFFYDESQTNQLVTTVIDRTGATNIYVHDNNYLLLSVTDGLGHKTSYSYDAFGNKVAVTNALLNVEQFRYDAGGNMRFSFDALTNTTSLQYDANNNLTNVVNATSNSASFVYDSSNNLTDSWDFMKNHVMRFYDSNAQIRQITSARQGITIFTNIGGMLASITDAATNTTSLGYDAVGRLIAITNADKFVTTNAYDLNDNLVLTSDGLGNKWRYTYDSSGRLLSEADPLNHTNFFYYNGNGDLTNWVDALGHNTFYDYDGEDRLAKIIDGNNHSRSIIYDAAGRIRAMSDALNHTNWFYYDAVGNLTSTIDSLFITNQLSYYDARNQPTNTQDALGHPLKMTYDPLMCLAQTIDALNRTNSFGYDGLNHLNTSTNPLSFITQQIFDGDGNLMTVINPKIAQTSFVYDLADRLIGVTNPITRKTSYTLNGRGLAEQIVQPSTERTILSYDASGRLTNAQDSAGSVSYSFYGDGRLNTVGENGLLLDRQYDSCGRLTNYVDSTKNNIRYCYDPVGNLTNLVYPDGKNVAYAYDAANRLTNVLDWANLTTSFSYDANGRLTNTTLPNGINAQRLYDDAGRLKLQQDTTPASCVIYQVKYGYDSANQITGETNLPATTPYQPNPVSMTFNADDSLATYCGQIVTNDANGNMVYGPLTNGFGSYTYNARNRLIGVGGVGYAYDPAGNRVAITNGTRVTRFVVNPNAGLSQVLMRIQSGVTNYYIYGTGLLYEVTQTATTTNVLIHHYDYRGSTVALTDGNGNVTDRVSYSPYGSIISHTGTNDTPFLFNGSSGVQTDASGLLYMRARYYNPTSSRFLNPDPIGLTGGLNYFLFATANPVNEIDPSGLAPNLNLIPYTVNYLEDHYLSDNYTDSRYFTVLTHGYGRDLGYGLWVPTDRNHILGPDGKRMSVSELGDLIMDSGWDGTQPIQLAVCWAGEGGNASFASQLANYLAIYTDNDVKVYASPYATHINSPITIYPNSASTLFNQWIPFKGDWSVGLAELMQRRNCNKVDKSSQAQ